jgi:protein TonB
MDLSLAHGEGGEGVGVVLGAAENVVYEAGEVDEQAKVLREINPVYPERAKKAGIAGTVKVLLIIDVYGNVSSVDVLSVNPPGYGFEVEAVKAVREWKFEPAKLGSYPVAQKATKEFNFVR